MSMENAILELAAAMREVAAAIKSMGDGGQLMTVTPVTEGKVVKRKGELTDAGGKVVQEADKPAIEDKPVEVDAKAAESMAEADEAHPEKDVELEAAVTKVEEDSKALDYTKDVRPVLLAVNKKAGQPALKALLNDFGAATGDKLKPEQYTDVLAAANKILAG